MAAKVDFKQVDRNFEGASVFHKIGYALWLMNDVERAFDTWGNDKFSTMAGVVRAELKELKAEYIKAAEARKRDNDAEAAKAGGRTQIDLDQLNKMQEQIAQLTAALAAKVG